MRTVTNGGLTSWALVYQPSGTSEQDRQFVCGCETIRKRALVASNNTVEFVTAHGVCSVFCPPQYRGKGYAGKMIVDLGEKLKTWQSKGQPNLFSVLWSDIGKVCKWWKVAAIDRSICHITINQRFDYSLFSITHLSLNRTSTPHEAGVRSRHLMFPSAQLPTSLPAYLPHNP
jgi:hypothetical protein